MGIIATFIIIASLYLLIQGALYAYKERQLMKLPYVYVKERKLKRKVRKDLEQMRQNLRKMHTQN